MVLAIDVPSLLVLRAASPEKYSSISLEVPVGLCELYAWQWECRCCYSASINDFRFTPFL